MLNMLRAPLMVAGIIVFAAPAQGEWSTDTTSPLVLGDVLGFGSEHAVVSTPDGAAWVAWIDNQCFPSFVVQRIDAEGLGFVAGALVLDTQDDCISLSPRLEAFSDNTVVASAIGNDPLSTPVHRIAADGTELWTPDVVADDGFSGGVHTLLALPGGNALVAGPDGTSIRVGRYAVHGTRVWDPPATFATGAGSNMRIFALEEDGADGAYVLWDTPGAYTRRVNAMRVAANGTLAWEGPTRMVDVPPGSSRHTDPVATADGLGGLVLVWTQGAEQSGTPVPVRMQRLFPDGTMLFDMAGSRVSTATTRQFDAQVRQRVPGGDIYVAWRDGPFDNQVVRIQRMTLTGQRLWGDTGALVTQIAGPASAFTLDWLDADTLGIAVTSVPEDSDAPRVNVHRVDALGQVAFGSWPISDAVPAGSIASAPLGGALAVVWQREGDNNLSEVVAQRINDDGTLGLADSDGDGVVDVADNCTVAANADQLDTDADGLGNRCDPDLDGNCQVNFSDLGLFKSVFFTTDRDADFDGSGTVNFSDLAIMKSFFFGPPGPSGLSDDCDL